MKKLVAINLPSLPVGDHYDHIFTGLVLRVGPSRRTWMYRYRQGGKRLGRQHGYFPKMSLGEAREAARNLADRVDAGMPLAAETPLHPRSPDTLTVGKLLDKYEAMRMKEGVRVKTLPRAMKALRNDLSDYLATPTAQFTKADLKKVRSEIFNRAPIMANRFMAYLGPVMKWGVQELDAFEHNFHGDIRKGRERRRQRVLTNAELKAVWNATFALEAEAGEGNAISRAKSGAARSYARLVRFLMLTLQRLDEGASLKGGDIIDSQWRFITKGNKPHRLKLPQLALDQTGAADARDLCFPGQRGSKITGWSKLKNKLDELSSVNGWVLHDLRRTGSTRLEEIGHDAALVHFILNHSRQGLSSVYMHSDLFDRMGAALGEWASEVERIAGASRAVS